MHKGHHFFIEYACLYIEYKTTGNENALKMTKKVLS